MSLSGATISTARLPLSKR
jgi:hypothetical protein